MYFAYQQGPWVEWPQAHSWAACQPTTPIHAIYQGEQPSPRCASKAPSGSAKEVSSSSGETKKAKGRTKDVPKGNHRPTKPRRIFCQSSRERTLTSQELTKDVFCLSAEYWGRMAAAALLGRLLATGTNSCILPSGRPTNIGLETA